MHSSFARAAAEVIVRVLGGKGSGHFGHAGRPGERGGSRQIAGSVSISHVGGTIKYSLSSATTNLSQDLDFVWEDDLLPTLDGLRPAGFSDGYNATKAGAAKKLNALLKKHGITKGFAVEINRGRRVGLATVSRERVNDKDYPDFLEAAADYLGGNGVTEKQERVLGKWLGFPKTSTEAYLKRKNQWHSGRTLGGKGSGNFGHAGRPGEVGGSGPAFPTGLKKVSSATGSNPGGVYHDGDGQKWYVKHYKNPEQALGEHLANGIYAAAGINAPVSVISARGEYASQWLENVKGTIQSEGLSKKAANQILDGFAADVFLSNWDTVGLVRDNIAVHGDGTVTRIDQGGTLLHRAQGALKPQSALNSLSEWDFFSSGNKEYRDVFTAAGVKDGNALGQRAVDQIEKLTAIRPSGGWAEFVNNRVPTASSAWKAKVSAVLETRHGLLLKKRDELKLRTAGGKGSGNFGHAGRPGEVGGSAPDGDRASIAARRVQEHLALQQVWGMFAGDNEKANLNVSKFSVDERIAIIEHLVTQPPLYARSYAFRNDDYSRRERALIAQAKKEEWSGEKTLEEFLAQGFLQREQSKEYGYARPGGTMVGLADMPAADRDEFATRFIEAIGNSNKVSDLRLEDFLHAGWTSQELESFSDKLQTHGASYAKWELNNEEGKFRTVDRLAGELAFFSNDYETFSAKALSGWALAGSTTDTNVLKALAGQLVPLPDDPITGEPGKFYVRTEFVQEYDHAKGEYGPRVEKPIVRDLELRYSPRAFDHLRRMKSETEAFYQAKLKTKDLTAKPLTAMRGIGGHVSAYTPAGIESWTTDKRTVDRFGKMMAERDDYSALETTVTYADVLWSYESMKGKPGWPPDKDLKGKKEFVLFGTSVAKAGVRVERR